MKTCDCGGDLLRHGVTHYKQSSIIGIRFRCRDCKKSKTIRMEKDDIRGIKFFNATGRPTLNDWRFA